MAKQIVRLTESDLHRIVENTVYNILLENDEEEGWLNQIKTGAKTLFNNNKASGLKDRWRKAKANYQTQGQIDSMDSMKSELQKVIGKLQELISAGVITPQTTVGQILSNQIKFNSFSGKRANLQGQLYRRGMNKPSA